MSFAEVLAGTRPWWVECAGWETFLPSLPADSVDLVLGSPPYEAARTYGIGFNLRGQDWVDWMVSLFREASRVSKGLVAMVLEGQTRDYRWTASPALLMADLHRAGFCLRKPPVYHRVGIPGSGGPDWLRNDYEFVVCVARPGKLPWSENTAMGHPPKWAPGGEMSHRMHDGKKVNAFGVRRDGVRIGGRRGADDHRAAEERPAHAKSRTDKRVADGTRGGEGRQSYAPPAVANPGNVIRCKVGGNLLGSSLAHENEAPFPESLAEFFVRSFCPPGGLVLDPFSGSGTTGAVAVRCGRRFVGCDVRDSQTDLSRRRISGETPPLPGLGV